MKYNFICEGGFGLRARLAIFCAAALAFLASSALLCAEQSAAGKWIVVTPPQCKPILAPLIERRQVEGFDVLRVNPAGRRAGPFSVYTPQPR